MKPSYNTSATELTVPFLNPPILISVRGKVTMKYTGTVLTEDPTATLELDWFDGKRRYSVAELVAHTFRPLAAHTNNWKDFEVCYLDGNPSNVHPSNLYHKPRYLPIESAMAPGTFLIPYYTRYSLTKDNFLVDSRTGNVRPFYMDSGYLKIRLVSDRGNKQLIALHRLLAMTYIPVDEPVETLVVDHINHDKLDNRIENLQWLTASEHGFKTGVLGEMDNVGVVSRNVHTGEIVNHSSIRAAARYYEIDYKTMVHRLNGNQKLYYPGVQYQQAAKLTDWREPSQEEIEKVMNSQKRPPQINITAIHDDGTTKSFNSIREAAEYTKVHPRTLRAASEKRVPNRKRDGWLFTFEKLKTGEIIKPLES